MTGKRKTNPAGSTNNLRGDVLRVLGVLKVATVEQIQQISAPHMSYRHTDKEKPSERKQARTASHLGALSDLRKHGLVENGGKTSGGDTLRNLTPNRVLAALAEAAKDGSEVSVAAIARCAGVDRTFLYRHRDLLGQIHAQAAEPPTVPGGRGPAVSRASLQAGLAAADARTARLAAQVRRPEARLSEALGEQVWRESGIGGPDDTEKLQARITTLEQQVVDLELKLQDQGDDLAAARAAHRELMAQLNRHTD